ncbi:MULTISPECIES: hypothetical protein [unclassified Paenarthrobacter]|uniref:hypothetical protein n=1 Tax=unclassified Paenarthrobacter TaxID=2634190 RepID=UPI003CF4E253
MDDPRQTARKYLEQHVITLDSLWARYWANGGSAKPLELEAYLYQAREPSPFDLEVLTWALEDLDAESRQ